MSRVVQIFIASAAWLLAPAAFAQTIVPGPAPTNNTTPADAARPEPGIKTETAANLSASPTIDELPPCCTIPERHADGERKTVRTIPAVLSNSRLNEMWAAAEVVISALIILLVAVGFWLTHKLRRQASEICTSDTSDHGEGETSGAKTDHRVLVSKRRVDQVLGVPVE